MNKNINLTYIPTLKLMPVLPAVYGDELSYYETLAHLQSALNTNTEQLANAFEQVYQMLVDGIGSGVAISYTDDKEDIMFVVSSDIKPEEPFTQESLTIAVAKNTADIANNTANIQTNAARPQTNNAIQQTNNAVNTQTNVTRPQTNTAVNTQTNAAKPQTNTPPNPPKEPEITPPTPPTPPPNPPTANTNAAANNNNTQQNNNSTLSYNTATYKTKWTDTLSSIATAELGDSRRWPSIAVLNENIINNDPDSIVFNIDIKIPMGEKKKVEDMSDSEKKALYNDYIKVSEMYLKKGKQNIANSIKSQANSILK